jgi:hypothetical protein
MRKRLAWLAGILGIAALARALRRRHAPTSAPAPPALTPDPADELRARLQQSREAEAITVPADDETSRDTVPLEERRARVHAKAQEAIDLMREPGEGA